MPQAKCQGYEGSYNGQLANLHPDIEPEEGDGQLPRRELKCFERTGKPKTVDEAEHKRRHPTTLAKEGAQIIERPQQNGERDSGLDNS